MKKRRLTQKEQILDHGRLIGILRKEGKELKTKYDSLDKRLKYLEGKMTTIMKWRQKLADYYDNVITKKVFNGKEKK